MNVYLWMSLLLVSKQGVLYVCISYESLIKWHAVERASVMSVLNGSKLLPISPPFENCVVRKRMRSNVCVFQMIKHSRCELTVAMPIARFTLRKG